MANKKKRLLEIDEDMFNKAIDLYWKWSDLNRELKEFYSRGVNLHEGITEMISCYVNGHILSLGGGSEDAIIPDTGELVQVKGTSNFDKDLTSFGPNSSFDYLQFVRLNQSEDKMYLYDIPVDNLDDIMVNQESSVKDFKEAGKRPRFSIIEKCIEENDLKPYAEVDLIKRTVSYLEENK